MENATLSLILGITDNRIKLGEAIIVTSDMVKKMNKIRIFKKGNIAYFLQDVKNFKAATMTEYANNILKYSSNVGDLISVLCLGEEFHKGICYENKYSNYKIDFKTYSYLYLQLWPKIAQTISKEFEDGKFDIKFYLRVTEITYKNFYPNLTSNNEKAEKLRDDIYIWMRYNILGDIYSKYKIEITSKNELLIPVEFHSL